jgi:hypothetical protein
MNHWSQVGISVMTKLRLNQRATRQDQIASAAEPFKGLRPLRGASGALERAPRFGCWAVKKSLWLFSLQQILTGANDLIKNDER